MKDLDAAIEHTTECSKAIRRAVDLLRAHRCRRTERRLPKDVESALRALVEAMDEFKGLLRILALANGLPDPAEEPTESGPTPESG